MAIERQSGTAVEPASHVGQLADLVARVHEAGGEMGLTFAPATPFQQEHQRCQVWAWYDLDLPGDGWGPETIDAHGGANTVAEAAKACLAEALAQEAAARGDAKAG